MLKTNKDVVEKYKIVSNLNIIQYDKFNDYELFILGKYEKLKQEISFLERKEELSKSNIFHDDRKLKSINPREAEKIEVISKNIELNKKLIEDVMEKLKDLNEKMKKFLNKPVSED